MARFKELAIGAKFTFENQVWEKITPVKRSCCTILFNAYVNGNKDIKKKFDDNQEVTPNNG